VDFVGLRDSIASHFKSDGRPAVEPILCLKLELVMFHDGLSDRQVFAKAKTDIAYRMFLGLGRNDHLPDVSTLRGFRSRLGVVGHQKVFHELIAQARNKLLAAAERFSIDDVLGERARIESIRETIDSQGNEARLVARVEHLRDILEWVTKLSAPEDAKSNAAWQRLQKSIEIVEWWSVYDGRF
jgi:hypothetical protein